MQQNERLLPILIANRENLGFYPPPFFFYQFLLFAVFDAVRLVMNAHRYTPDVLVAWGPYI